jgi:hypothetical protein
MLPTQQKQIPHAHKGVIKQARMKRIYISTAQLTFRYTIQCWIAAYLYVNNLLPVTPVQITWQGNKTGMRGPNSWSCIYKITWQGNKTEMHLYILVSPKSWSCIYKNVFSIYCTTEAL